MFRISHTLISIAALAVSGIWAWPCLGGIQEPTPEFLLGANWPERPWPRTPRDEATPVRIDFERLASLRPGDRIALGALLGGLDGRVTRKEERSPTRYSVFGDLEHVEHAFFVITVERDAVAALFANPFGEPFGLRYFADGVHELAPAVPSEEERCGTIPGSGPSVGRGPAAAGPLEPLLSPATDTWGTRGGCDPPPRRFDVMIYYTQAARASAGGTSAIQAGCQNAVDVANDNYLDSLVTPRLALIFREEIAYTESGSLETDLDRLQDPSDGVMDDVHGERDEYGGDFVCLWVDESDPNYAGYAYCTPSASEGFCVVEWDNAASSTDYTFAHELGHLQGCAHNPEDAGSGCNEFDFSFGHRFFGSSGSGWRTIMAYNDTAGTYATVGVFSNPFVTVDGVPAGVLEEFYNTATINSTSQDRELWRFSKFDVWVDFSAGGPYFYGTYLEPYPFITPGIIAIYDGTDPTYVTPTLWVMAGSTSETPTIVKAMVIQACGGSVTIGE